MPQNKNPTIAQLVFLALVPQPDLTVSISGKQYSHPLPLGQQQCSSQNKQLPDCKVGLPQNKMHFRANTLQKKQNRLCMFRLTFLSHFLQRDAGLMGFLQTPLHLNGLVFYSGLGQPFQDDY